MNIDFFWKHLIGIYIGDRKTIIAIRCTMKLTSKIKGNCGFDVPLGPFTNEQYLELCIPRRLRMEYSPFPPGGVMYVEDGVFKYHYLRTIVPPTEFTEEYKAFQKFKTENDVLRINWFLETDTNFFIQSTALTNETIQLIADCYVIKNKSKFISTKLPILRPLNRFACVECHGSQKDFELNIVFDEVFTKENLVLISGMGTEQKIKLISNVKILCVAGFCGTRSLELICPNLEFVSHRCNRLSCQWRNTPLYTAIFDNDIGFSRELSLRIAHIRQVGMDLNLLNRHRLAFSIL